ncbi:MAG: DNA internalization-related competence protein ComEC/Rec2 [Actinobacteria bacterium]|nr:DNA internalization-related competence protein ComEC/Rec2 [Actinomycetota bacterium]
MKQGLWGRPAELRAAGRRLGCGLLLRKRMGLARTATGCVVGGLVVASLGIRGYPILAVLVGLAAAVLGVATVWCGPRRSDVVPVMILLLALTAGLVWGSSRARSIDEGPLAAHMGEEVELVLLLEESPAKHGKFWSGKAQVLSLISADNAHNERIITPVWMECFDRDDIIECIPVGTVLQGRGEIRPPAPASEGFNQRTYLRGLGVGWVFHAQAAELRAVGSCRNLTTWFADLRERVCSLLAAGIPSAHGGLLQGVLLGIKDHIPREVSDNFRRSGLSHMLTVSGSHIAWIIAGVLVLARAAGLPRWTGFVMAAAALLVFVPLTDGGPSVLRAALTGGLLICARLLGRGRDTWHLLLLAALILLSINPYLALTPGMQLSFSAVMGILCFAARFQQGMKRLPASVATVAAVTLAATLGTAPVSLAHFGQVPLGSLPANLLAVPTMPAVTGLCLASASVGLMWPMGAIFLNQISAVLVEWCMRVASWCSMLPVLPRSSVGLVICAVGGYVAVLVAQWWRNRSRRSVGGSRLLTRAGLRRRLLPMMGVVLGCVLYLTGAWLLDGLQVAWAARSWPAHGEVRVLDVGQGSAALIRTPDRQAVLVDAGPKGCGLYAQLRALGVRRLDVVIISHPHEDHFGGLAEVAEAMEIERFVDGPDGGVLFGLGGQASDSGAAEAERYLQLREELKEKGVVCARLSANMCAQMGGCLIHIDVPGPEVAFAGDANAASLVVTVTIGALDILLPGDAEAKELRDLELSPVDVLVVGHHGSRGALTQELLGRLQPAVSVISVGEGNSFRHPHQETLEFLDEAGVTCLRTDLVGTVVVSPLGQREGIRVWSDGAGTTDAKPIRR